MAGNALFINDMHTKTLADQVKEAGGFSSLREAVEVSLRDKLASLKDQDDPIDVMNKLQAKLDSFRGSDFKQMSDEDIRLVRLELSKGL